MLGVRFVVPFRAEDWLRCLFRGARVYTPVHVIPILLFRLRQVILNTVVESMLITT